MAATTMRTVDEQPQREPRQTRLMAPYDRYAPHIPAELVGNCQFLAYAWGTTSLPATDDGSLHLVTLTVDFGVQHSMRILAEAGKVTELLKRELRCVTLRHTPEGLDVTGIRTDGLGFAEVDGWSIPSSTTY